MADLDSSAQYVQALLEEGVHLYETGNLMEALTCWVQLLQIDAEHELAREYVRFVGEQFQLDVQAYLAPPTPEEAAQGPEIWPSSVPPEGEPAWPDAPAEGLAPQAWSAPPEAAASFEALQEDLSGSAHYSAASLTEEAQRRPSEDPFLMPRAAFSGAYTPEPELPEGGLELEVEAQTGAGEGWDVDALMRSVAQGAEVSGAPVGARAAISRMPAASPPVEGQTGGVAGGRPSVSQWPGRASRPAEPQPPVAGRASGGPVAGRASGGPVAGRASGGPVAGRASGGPVAGRASGGPVAGRASVSQWPGRASRPAAPQPPVGAPVGSRTSGPAAGRSSVSQRLSRPAAPAPLVQEQVVSAPPHTDEAAQRAAEEALQSGATAPLPPIRAGLLGYGLVIPEDSEEAPRPQQSAHPAMLPPSAPSASLDFPLPEVDFQVFEGMDEHSLQGKAVAVDVGGAAEAAFGGFEAAEEAAFDFGGLDESMDPFDPFEAPAGEPAPGSEPPPPQTRSAPPQVSADGAEVEFDFGLSEGVDFEISPAAPVERGRKISSIPADLTGGEAIDFGFGLSAPPPTRQVTSRAPSAPPAGPQRDFKRPEIPGLEAPRGVSPAPARLGAAGASSDLDDFDLDALGDALLGAKASVVPPATPPAVQDAGLDDFDLDTLGGALLGAKPSAVPPATPPAAQGAGLDDFDLDALGDALLGAKPSAVPPATPPAAQDAGLDDFDLGALGDALLGAKPSAVPPATPPSGRDDALDAFDFDAFAEVPAQPAEAGGERTEHAARELEIWLRNELPKRESRPPVGAVTDAAPAQSQAQGAQVEPLGQLMRQAWQKQLAGDFTGALALVEQVLEQESDHEEAQRYLRENTQRLLGMYRSRLGAMDHCPALGLRPQDIIWRNFDHRTGFLLSQIDGHTSFEDLIEIAGMEPLEATRILAKLKAQGIIQ